MPTKTLFTRKKNVSKQNKASQTVGRFVSISESRTTIPKWIDSPVSSLDIEIHESIPLQRVTFVYQILLLNMKTYVVSARYFGQN